VQKKFVGIKKAIKIKQGLNLEYRNFIEIKYIFNLIFY